ncbi:hypothetical protein N8I71_08735, partial [Roseibacterium sp. SDUM158016]|uniref:hypothetical protein n=1 Tax=Roseicyclus sediminis TaxID=2980997 RepID=UPI0021D122EA
VLVAMAAPVAAQTPCPTRADLPGGVNLVRIEPYFASSFSLAAYGLTETRVIGRGEDARNVTARYVHGLLNIDQREARGDFAMTLDADPALLDRLPEIGVWESAVSATWNGDFVGHGVYAAIFVETVPWEIGECTYDTWYVQETLVIDTLDPIFVDKYYAPALGLVIATVMVTQEGEAISNVVYDEVTAR